MHLPKLREDRLPIPFPPALYRRSLPVMRYYYTDASSRTTGPVDESFLYQACRIGAISAQTMLTPEGHEEWKPLEDVLPYFFSYRGEAMGPLTLTQIRAFAQHSPDPVQVTEPGGSEWQPLPGIAHAAPLPPPLPVATPVLPPHVAAAPPARHSGRGRPAFPGGVRAAGIIWIVYGGLRLLATAFVVLNFALFQPDLLAVGLLIAGIPLFVGIVFLRLGIKAVRGTVTSLRANAVGSIGIAVVVSLMQYMFLSPNTEAVFLIDLGLSFLLFLAGLMALSENDRFLAWQEARPSGAPRRR